MREGESRARDEMREIREEVNNIREMIPKVIGSASRGTNNGSLISVI
jgi:hypothetical protein